MPDILAPRYSFTDWPQAHTVFEIDCLEDYEDIERAANSRWGTCTVYYRWVMFDDAPNAERDISEFVAEFAPLILGGPWVRR